jgi:hypothetical protein
VLVNLVITSRHSSRNTRPAIAKLIIGVFLLVSMIATWNICPNSDPSLDGAAASSEVWLCQQSDNSKSDKGGRHRHTLCLSCAVASPPVVFPASTLIIVRSVVYGGAPKQLPSAERYQVLGWATTWSSRAPPVFA